MTDKPPDLMRDWLLRLDQRLDSHMSACTLRWWGLTIGLGTAVVFLFGQNQGWW